jgi:hypothetical protein
MGRYRPLIMQGEKEIHIDMMNVPSLFASFIICMLFLQVKDEQQI